MIEPLKTEDEVCQKILVFVIYVKIVIDEYKQK